MGDDDLVGLVHNSDFDYGAEMSEFKGCTCGWTGKDFIAVQIDVDPEGDVLWEDVKCPQCGAVIRLFNY